MKTQPYYVYVIELNKEVLNNKKFMSRNPDYAEGKPCVYVGQSIHPPEVRFNQHLDGHKANRYARDYGVRLRPKIYEKLNPLFSRDEAESKEQWLTERLRKKGYAVWSN
jgi:hypothetical protein